MRREGSRYDGGFGPGRPPRVGDFYSRNSRRRGVHGTSPVLLRLLVGAEHAHAAAASSTEPWLSSSSTRRRSSSSARRRQVCAALRGGRVFSPSGPALPEVERAPRVERLRADEVRGAQGDAPGRGFPVLRASSTPHRRRSCTGSGRASRAQRSSRGDESSHGCGRRREVPGGSSPPPAPRTSRGGLPSRLRRRARRAIHSRRPDGNPPKDLETFRSIESIRSRSDRASFPTEGQWGWASKSGSRRSI